MCLNPWKLITGSPICSTNFTNHLLIVEGCIGFPSACTNNLLESIHNSPQSSFWLSYHNLYSSSNETTKSGIPTSLIEFSVLGILVNIPSFAKYWLERLMHTIPFLKSTSFHSRPISSPSLTPVNSVNRIATLYLIWSSASSIKLETNALLCSSS